MITMSDPRAKDLAKSVIPMNDVAAKFDVPSQRVGVPSYEVTLTPFNDQRWHCTCKGFHYNSDKTQNYHCRHITAVIVSLAEQSDEVWDI